MAEHPSHTSLAPLDLPSMQEQVYYLETANTFSDEEKELSDARAPRPVLPISSQFLLEEDGSFDQFSELQKSILKFGLRDYLTGRTFANLSKLREMMTAAGFFTCSACVCLLSIDKVSPRIDRLISQQMEKLPLQPTFWIPMPENKAALLLSLSEGTGMREIKEAGQGLLSALREEKIDANLCVGQIVNGFSELPGSYRAAEFAWSGRLLYGKNNVIVYDELPQLSPRAIPVAEEDIRALCDAADAMDNEQCKRVIHRIFFGGSSSFDLRPGAAASVNAFGFMRPSANPFGSVPNGSKHGRNALFFGKSGSVFRLGRIGRAYLRYLFLSESRQRYTTNP